MSHSKTKKPDEEQLSDYAVLIKKMRLLKKLNRQQAALLFDFSFKTIEKLENGRGNISVQRFHEFQEKYGFSDKEIEELRTGKLKASTDANEIKGKTTSGERPERRFCHRKITRECKVLKELRLRKNIDQYEASKLCGYGKNTIGYIENGRVSLTDKKIQHIVEGYGQSMELFNQMLKEPSLSHEMIEQCFKIISQLDRDNLQTVLSVLRSIHLKK